VGNTRFIRKNNWTTRGGEKGGKQVISVRTPAPRCFNHFRKGEVLPVHSGTPRESTGIGIAESITGTGEKVFNRTKTEEWGDLECKLASLLGNKTQGEGSNRASPPEGEIYGCPPEKKVVPLMNRDGPEKQTGFTSSSKRKSTRGREQGTNRHCPG